MLSNNFCYRDHINIFSCFSCQCINLYMCLLRMFNIIMCAISFTILLPMHEPDNHTKTRRDKIKLKLIERLFDCCVLTSCSIYSLF